MIMIGPEFSLHVLFSFLYTVEVVFKLFFVTSQCVGANCVARSHSGGRLNDCSRISPHLSRMQFGV